VFEKHKKRRVVVSEVQLRGALLDPDELVGTWLRDQELLFAECGLPEAPAAAAVAGGGDAATGAVAPGSVVAHGVLVAHEPPPPTTETCELKVRPCRLLFWFAHLLHRKALASQAIALAVLGLAGSGKTTLVSAFLGNKAASGATTGESCGFHVCSGRC
jgi:hypothetical protein